MGRTAVFRASMRSCRRMFERSVEIFRRDRRPNPSTACILSASAPSISRTRSRPRHLLSFSDGGPCVADTAASRQCGGEFSGGGEKPREWPQDRRDLVYEAMGGRMQEGSERPAPGSRCRRYLPPVSQEAWQARIACLRAGGPRNWRSKRRTCPRHQIAGACSIHQFLRCA